MTNPELWGDLADRYRTPGPRRMLALDGGGIRGVLTLSILKAIETQLGVARLSDYFDYIAGTSTGAIIASGLAIGKSVDELIDFYRSTGTAMFERTRYLERLNSLYRNGPLEQQLKSVFGATTDLKPPRASTNDGQPRLKTLLLVVTRNVTTDSPWPISTNPEARYNRPDRDDCNLCIPLWQLVRASTAAPIYFPPEVIQVHPTDPAKTFVFVDGGITPYNNPAFVLYRFATHPAYRLNWPTGERHLQLVSVGTGAGATDGATPDSASGNIVSTGLGVPTALMYGALVDQDVNCRTVGRCTYGDLIDRELLDMVPREGADEGKLAERLKRQPVPLDVDMGRQFLFTRYNVDLSATGLKELGFGHIDPAAAKAMDKADAPHIQLLLDIGTAAARQVNVKAHFGPFAPASAGA
ncbi:MAG TPA: patatin-like phospholipase family protein [Vicinamibacterales bacterium]|nr:patatin-like phospholipase family protein [Vicinamibacterales bacterium]